MSFSLTLDDIESLAAGLPEVPFEPEKPLTICADVPNIVPWDGPSLITKIATCEADIDRIGGVVTWSFIDRKFRHFATHENFLRYVLSIDPSQRTFCERIYGNQSQKLRLDIDSPDNVLTAQIISQVVTCVQEAFERMFGEYVLRECVYVCDSTRVGKQSLHIIIDKYYVTDYKIASAFARSVQDELRLAGCSDAANCIDMNIYKTATSLRTAYNYKKDPSSVKKIPTHAQAIDTLITFVDNCREAKPRVNVECNEHKHENIGKNTEEYVAKILDLVPGHRFRNARGGSLNFNRIVASKCHISGREHTNDNTLFAVANDGKIYAKCRHCPGVLYICDTKVVVTDQDTGQDTGRGDEVVAPQVGKPKKTVQPIEAQRKREARVRELCNSEYQPKKITAKSITVYEGKMNTHGDYMNDYPDPPTLHIKATMGCGKTEALRRHIAKIAPNSVLVISHRVSFTIDVCAKFGYKSYQMIDGEINVKTAPFVVVQCESLHRVNSGYYEMVVCDEIESIIAQMFAPTHRRANVCWRIFESQIKFTDRLITMDGNLSQETIDIISEIREDRAEIVHNTVIPQISRHKIITSKAAAVAVLMKLIGKGDRAVVPTSSIKMAKKLHKMIRTKYPDKKILMYTSETSAEERERTLRDVNSSWQECDVLIYTPTISAGVSFTVHHFDSFVGFWYDSSCDVFTALQMLRRSRHISSGIYYHYICETGHNLPDTPEALTEYVSVSMKHALEYMEDPDAEILSDGGLVFEKTPRFHAWLNIHVRRNHSQTHFLQSLIRELKLIGGVVEPLITSSFEGNIAIEKEVRGQLRAIGEDILAEDAAIVADAPELTAEDIEGLSDRLSPKNRAAVAKYYLRRCYNYNGVVTPAIARTYGDRSLKMQYHARKNLREVRDEVFASPDDAVKILGKRFCNVMIRDFARADGSELDNLQKLFDFNRDSICVKMLNILGLKLGDAKILTREEVVRALDTKSVGGLWLSANYKLICTTFGTKIVNPPSANDPNFLRSILDFINGKLKSRYGISIKLTAQKSDRYHIDDPFAKLFTDTMEIPEPDK